MSPTAQPTDVVSKKYVGDSFSGKLQTISEDQLRIRQSITMVTSADGNDIICRESRLL